MSFVVGKGVMAMYDVEKMKSDIENEVSPAKEGVKNQFADAFRRIYVSSKVPESFDGIGVEVKVSRIACHKDLESIFPGPGFYIIFTDSDVGQNPCRLVLGEQCRAVYRGESYLVRKRVQSHLFNRWYRQDYEDREQEYVSRPEKTGKAYYEPFWPACLRLGDGSNGIDVDNDKYSKSQWFVVVHSMKGSSQEVRKQAERAFDDVFGKPVASKERA